MVFFFFILKLSFYFKLINFVNMMIVLLFMSGLGLFFVMVRIFCKDIMDELMYMNWYDNDYIVEIIEMSGFNLVFCFICKDCDMVLFLYFVFYFMDDVVFFYSFEFKKIRVYSELLFGLGLVYDFVDNEVWYYGLKEVIDMIKKGKG